MVIDSILLDDSQHRRLQAIATAFAIDFDALYSQLEENITRHFSERVDEEVEFWLDEWAE